jgi:LPXTG-motif cell wall-anchored protein
MNEPLGFVDSVSMSIVRAPHSNLTLYILIGAIIVAGLTAFFLIRRHKNNRTGIIANPVIETKADSKLSSNSEE